MLAGYKCFNSDLTNNYGFQFELGNSYHVDGEIKAGLNGNGFHMCRNIEDTFRFYGVMNSQVRVCEVIGSGQMVSFCDEYNGYFDMYSVENIKIVRELDRTEIINMALLMCDVRAMRFVQVYKLTSEEIQLFKEVFAKYSQVLNAIAYYQEGKTEVFQSGYTLKKDKFMIS